MLVRWLVLSTLLLNTLGCRSEESGLPISTDNSSQPPSRVPYQPVVPPINGGALTPPALPANSVETTTGGFVTVNKVMSYTVANTPDLLGAGESEAGIYLLMERYVNNSIKMWDVFKIVGDAASVRVCTVSKPGGGYDRMNGLVYDGSSFRMYAETGDYPSWQRIYTFNVDTCLLATYRSVSSVYSYSSSGLFALAGAKAYFEYSSTIRVFDMIKGTNQEWTYSTASVAGARPSPMNSTFSVGGDGSAWHMDSSRRLWKGTQAGQWTGFAQFPSYPYSDLSQAKFILPNANGVRVVTYNKYSSSPVMIYHLKTDGF